MSILYKLSKGGNENACPQSPSVVASNTMRTADIFAIVDRFLLILVGYKALEHVRSFFEYLFDICVGFLSGVSLVYFVTCSSRSVVDCAWREVEKDSLIIIL